MPRPSRLAGIFSCFVLASAVGPVEATTAEEVALARERVYPSLVNIAVVNRRFSEGRTHRSPGAGSGVIITAEGHVLTNYHVAGETSRIECTLTDGRVFVAEIVANDPLTDLSVLRLLTTDGEVLPTAELGRSGDLEVGQTVFAMGNPLALSSSMTQGIISNPARVFTDFMGTEMREISVGEGNLSGLLTRWIQHDALILPGNSGGPLVDLEGRVIGINELGGRGMGFAIPADIVREVLRQALEIGRVERGWLGLAVLPVSKLGRDRGALVSSVLPGSAADTAGVEAGDILLAVDGDPVTVRFFEEVPLLYERLARLTPGDDVVITLFRDGATVVLDGTVAAMERFKGEEAEIATLGVTVQEVTPPMRLAKSLDDSPGLLVTGIRPGSSFDRSRPRPAYDDLLVTIGDTAVSTIEALRGAAGALAPDEDFLVELQRRNETLLSVAPAPDPDLVPFGGELPRAWLGLSTQVLTPDLARHLGREGATGYRVTQVLPWTQAESAGFVVGDILVAMGDQSFEASRLQDAEDLQRRIEESYIGDEVSMTVLRGPDRLELSVELESRPEGSSDVETAEQSDLDFSVRDITFLDRVSNRWDLEVRGVVVTEATRGGWGQMAGLRLEDLVLEIDDEAVPDIVAFEAVIRRLVERRPSVVTIFLRRGYRTHFVFIEPDWPSVEEEVGAGL